MIYNLLKRIQNLLASKPSGTKEEQEILSLVSQALPAMLNGHDTETLAANELLVRICPDTKRPVLVCHNGNGQCLCLHNGTTEEDAVDVDLWLRSNGRECNGYNKLQEAVVDLAYNAGADNLWEDRDSRAVNAEIVQWAEEFETEHAGTDWDAEDYFLAIDRFYKEKTKQMNPVTIQEKKKNGNRMDKEIAEEIIRENRYPSGYDIQDYLFDNEDTVLSLEDGTELLDDFDLWKERSDLELEKIMDRNYWSSTGGY